MKRCLKCEHVFSLDGWNCPVCDYTPIFLNGVVAHAPSLANDGGGFKPQYFSELARLEATNFWFQARNKIILWTLRTYIPNFQNFLEVGCGTGFVLSAVSKAHPEVALSGSEIFVAGLSHATERIHSANFMQMDARDVPFVDEFDVIGAFDVLEHIEEDEAVLAQLHRALKPGGVLLLTVPQHPWLWSVSDEYACHVRRYTCLEIEAKVRIRSFEILNSTSFVTTLLPVMMLSRVLQKINPNSSDPTDELKISPFLNKILYSLMMLELSGIRIGLSYPIGGSRLIVARKL